MDSSATLLFNATALHEAPHSAAPHVNGVIMLTGPAERMSSFRQTTSSWIIAGCTNKHRRKQTVLAYCNSLKPEVDCAGIFINGAKHTIIQLPDDCGASPFGHVLSFVPTRRKLPSAERKKIGKNLKKYTVYELVFDYNFKSIPYKRGDAPVKMHMEFSNKPGVFKMKNFSKVRPYHTWLANFNDQTFQNSNTIPIDHDFSANLATLQQQCNGFAMSLDMDIMGNINGSINYGYYVSGSIVPPVINEHYAYLNANSYVMSNVNMTGLIKYTFTLATIPIVPSIGLPGLNYAGLLSIGPYFEINTVLSGDIAVDGTVNVQSGFNTPAVDISIGNNSAPQSSSDATNFADVTFSKDIQVSAGLTLALVPQLGIGIKVFDNVVDADVSIQLSGGITAGGSANINTQTGNITNPCVELDGSLNLNWVVGGKLGPWGAAVTGRIWGIQKKLWQDCFKGTSRKRSISSEGEWKKAYDRSSEPFTKQHHPNRFASLVCPSVNPFGNSTGS